MILRIHQKRTGFILECPQVIPSVSVYIFLYERRVSGKSTHPKFPFGTWSNVKIFEQVILFISLLRILFGTPDGVGRILHQSLKRGAGILVQNIQKSQEIPGHFSGRQKGVCAPWVSAGHPLPYG